MLSLREKEQQCAQKDETGKKGKNPTSNAVSKVSYVGRRWDWVLLKKWVENAWEARKGNSRT